MGSAIWSSSTKDMFDFPILFFIQFFKNHGLLSVNNRPQWRVIKGGSKQYLKPLTNSFKQNIHVNSSVTSINRSNKGVELRVNNGEVQKFDQVVIACHSDQALSMIEDCNDLEKQLLEAIPYRNNEVVLHTDDSLLPEKKRAWSSWNYWLRKGKQSKAVLTYNMNILQGIKAPCTFVVTLNATDAIAPEKILASYQYSHPVFSLKSVKAVEDWGGINGVNKTWFCGAYWANGFHEDGVTSALRVAQSLGCGWKNSGKF
jgi:predicted NAD/FAD-binding protein